MKETLLRRWALFVLRQSRTAVWPYFCLILTAVLTVLQFTRYAHVHFLLIAAILTLMAFERWAFADLLAEKDAEIGRHMRGGAASSQPGAGTPPN